MILRQSDFAASFRAHVVPKLAEACRSRGLFLALNLLTYSGAVAEVMHIAQKHRVFLLPDEHFAALETWIGDQILARAAESDVRIEAHQTRMASVHADIDAWDERVRGG